MPERAHKPGGFTLVLDGTPDEVQRIIDAVAREYQRVEEEALTHLDYGLFGATSLVDRLRARSSLRGRIELRYDAHSVLGRPEGRTT